MLAPFPTTSDSDLPAGDSFASATMSALGSFNLVGYSSSGSKLSYSSPLLETNKVPLYTRPDGFARVPCWVMLEVQEQGG